MSDIETKEDFAAKTCKACEGGVAPLTEAEIQKYFNKFALNWELRADNKEMSRTLNFNNYYETMAFVNALALMAHKENHHPDLSVHYNKCVICYSTHAIGGLSENDIICAVKADKIFEGSNHA